MIDVKNLDEIIIDALQALEESKKQAYDIAETTREEYQKTCRELHEVNRELYKTVRNISRVENRLSHPQIELHKSDKTDRLQKLLRDLLLREKLARVKRDYLKKKSHEQKKVLQKTEDLLLHLTRSGIPVSRSESSIPHKRMVRVFKETKHLSVAPGNDYRRLTKREMDVLQLVAEGANNKSIAEKLFITEKTVKNHMTNIFQKLEVTDRTQAALYAIKKRMVHL